MLFIKNRFIFVYIKPLIMNTEQKIQELRNQLDAIYSVMPETFFQQQQRDKSAFLITKELELLENPVAYQQNSNHWEGYEIRF